MRPLSLLVALVVLAGCAATAPTLASPPLSAPAVVVVEPPPPPPMVVVEAPAMVEVEPVEPPPVPEMRIDRRSVFERAGAVEWTLANGLTVVYVRHADAEGYHARVVAPTGWASLPPERAAAVARLGGPTWGAMTARVEPGERIAVGTSDGLVSLLDDVVRLLTQPPDGGGDGLAEPLFATSPDVTVLLLGARDRAWIEPSVAGVLGGLPARRDAFGASSSLDAGLSIRGDWADLPAVWILNDALADRAEPGGEAGVRFDPDAGRIRLIADGTPRPVLLAGLSDDDLRRARDRAAHHATTPAGRLEAFAVLYGLPGAFRPARDPADAAGLAGRIARTPPAAAADLLRRLGDAR